MAVLIADVQPDHIGGNALGAQAVGDTMHLGGRHIAVPGLLEAKSPCRCQGRLPGEIRIPLDDVMNARPINQVVIDRSGGGAEGQRLGILLAKVEPAAPGIIEQDSGTAAWPTRGHEEGNAILHGICRFLTHVPMSVPYTSHLTTTSQPYVI